jgi:putative toxin-antitoxin system antitoxin component (TIGR02293 family)
MQSATNKLMSYFKDPIKEIETIRKGVNPELIENFLNDQSFVVKDVLSRLKITTSTYFAKKKDHKLLDSSSTEKFFRLVSTVQNAQEILGSQEAKNWLYRKIPSLGFQVPMDLLDTETGHRMVEHALLQIKYGIYN